MAGRACQLHIKEKLPLWTGAAMLTLWPGILDILQFQCGTAGDVGGISGVTVSITVHKDAVLLLSTAYQQAAKRTVMRIYAGECRVVSQKGDILL